ncbi:hypothetical protein SAMN04487947_0881 [Halogeometricum rufum]|jgi:hypothetical protein|uniref:Uncharacterized protein n=1 Tax=Halogeometricum rufum TaxID=553469 RepID=A0A1I6GBL3_9EURY|nr:MULTISPECIES: hypothetical protein [Halogeometricum]MUV58982.1 hypothetical protein [Halogeometricum sp. CBA1124]SFR39594.1 hypothetical protein SAMN04487947_0881 [Halogeometricum rufum]
MNALAVERTDERTGQTRRIEVTEFRTARVVEYARTRFAGDADVHFERRAGTTTLVADERR